jgi:hypothetical protein
VRAKLRESVAAGTTSAAADAATLTHTSSHVRSNSPAIASLIAQATERSATFRRLVEDIDASDSYVYVNEGHCGHAVRACFVTVTSSAGVAVHVGEGGHAQDHRCRLDVALTRGS